MTRVGRTPVSKPPATTSDWIEGMVGQWVGQTWGAGELARCFPISSVLLTWKCDLGSRPLNTLTWTWLSVVCSACDIHPTSENMWKQAMRRQGFGLHKIVPADQWRKMVTQRSVEAGLIESKHHFAISYDMYIFLWFLEDCKSRQPIQIHRHLVVCNGDSGEPMLCIRPSSQEDAPYLFRREMRRMDMPVLDGGHSVLFPCVLISLGGVAPSIPFSASACPSSEWWQIPQFSISENL